MIIMENRIRSALKIWFNMYNIISMNMYNIIGMRPPPDLFAKIDMILDITAR